MHQNVISFSPQIDHSRYADADVKMGYEMLLPATNSLGFLAFIATTFVHIFLAGLTV